MSKTPGNLAHYVQNIAERNEDLSSDVWFNQALKKKTKKNCASLKGFEGIPKVYKQYWNHCLNDCMVAPGPGSKAGTKHDAPSTMFHSYKVLVCSDEFLSECILVSHVSTTQCPGSVVRS